MAFGSAGWIVLDVYGCGYRQQMGIMEAEADVASLTAFEVGLFGWMALMNFVFFPAPHHLHPDSPVYWFLMQLGMIAGFFTAWPVNTAHPGRHQRSYVNGSRRGNPPPGGRCPGAATPPRRRPGRCHSSLGGQGRRR